MLGAFFNGEIKGGAHMEILILIAKIILLIAQGLGAIQAVNIVASSSGVSFDTLWSNLPSKYK